MSRPSTAATAGLASILHDTPAGSLALAAAVAATATVSADHSDAALLDLGRRWSALSMGWQRFDLDAPRHETREECDARLTTLVQAEGEIVAAIRAAPASTPAGLAVKARVLIREASGEDFPVDEAAVLAHAGNLMHNGCGIDGVIGSLCLDLLRLAQEAGR